MRWTPAGLCRVDESSALERIRSGRFGMRFDPKFGGPLKDAPARTRRRAARVATVGAVALTVIAGVLSVVPGANAASFAGFEVAFQADTSRLWTIGPDGRPFETFSAMAPNTSPSIAGLSTGGFQMAFVASDGTLWIQTATSGQQYKPCVSPYQI